ncbi:MAG: hypothetical protein ACKO69_10990, partial [Limnohabitans sp.]
KKTPPPIRPKVMYLVEAVFPQNRKNDNPNGQVGQSVTSIGKRVFKPLNADKWGIHPTQSVNLPCHNS